MATNKMAAGICSLQEMCLEVAGRLGLPFGDSDFRYLLKKQKLDVNSFAKVGWYRVFWAADVDRVEKAARKLRKYRDALVPA